MPRLTAPNQLETFRKKQVELAKKIKAAEAKRRQKERDEDQRRKLVLGAAVLAYFDQPEQRAHRTAFLKAMFDGRAVSAADRALFKALLVESASQVENT